MDPGNSMFVLSINADQSKIAQDPTGAGPRPNRKL